MVTKGGGGGGGATKQEGGASEGWGDGISFSYPEGRGGGTSSFWVVLTQVLEVLTILERGRGAHKVSTL